MVMKDTQGQQLCHERFVGVTPCVPPQCAEQCTAKWGQRQGRGTCLGGPGPANTCLCTFKCQIWFFLVTIIKIYLNKIMGW